MTKIIGRWASLREKFLRENAPHIYEEMSADGSLEKHLESIQERVSDYIDNRVNAMKRGEEYRRAEEKGDFAEKRRLIETEQLYAEGDAELEWIYVLPDIGDSDQDESEAD